MNLFCSICVQSNNLLMAITFFSFHVKKNSWQRGEGKVVHGKWMFNLYF